MHYGILKQPQYGNESKPGDFILIGSLKDKRGCLWAESCRPYSPCMRHNTIVLHRGTDRRRTNHCGDLWLHDFCPAWTGGFFLVLSDSLLQRLSLSRKIMSGASHVAYVIDFSTRMGDARRVELFLSHASSSHLQPNR